MLTQEEFDTAAADLEKSIQEGSKPTETDPSEKFVKAVRDAANDLLKGKGGQGDDCKADKDSRGSLIEAGKDPADAPKKSGEGYKDSAKYEARKGHDDEEEEETEEEEAPSFFSKGHGKKKKMKKKFSSGGRMSSSGMEKGDDDEDEADATEFMENMGEAVDSLHKSVRRLEEGLACFGELLTDMADPRKDKLNLSIAKAINHLVSENREIKKSLGAHQNLMKAIGNLPGAPRVAGLPMASTLQENADLGGPVEGELSSTKQLSKAIRDQLFVLQTARKVDSEMVKKALKGGEKEVIALITSFKK